MAHVSQKQAAALGMAFKIDYKVVPFSQWWYGLNVELEHGKRNPLTNVTDDDLIDTTKIVLAHLLEAPNYYAELKKMEEKFRSSKKPIQKA